MADEAKTTERPDVTAGGVPDRLSFPATEETVLKLWQHLDAFKTQLRLSEVRPAGLGVAVYLRACVSLGTPCFVAPAAAERLLTIEMQSAQGKPEFNFYDGPPFATGLPHYGHILAGTIKDIVTRFAHGRGMHVERRFGWDTHGLPVEFEIDKKLGIKGISVSTL